MPSWVVHGVHISATAIFQTPHKGRWARKFTAVGKLSKVALSQDFIVTRR